MEQLQPSTTPTMSTMFLQQQQQQQQQQHKP
jgi:hypothetical protein